MWGWFKIIKVQERLLIDILYQNCNIDDITRKNVALSGMNVVPN